MNEDVIHVFGDSHVALFSGVDKRTLGVPNFHDCVPRFRTYEFGPILAYRFHSFYRQSENLFDYWITINNIERVMLYIGEIDVRVHLVKQAQKQHRSIDVITEEAVSLYLEGVVSVSAKIADITLFGPHPQYRQPDGVLRDFHYGSYEDIYEAGERFNFYLEKNRPPNIKFATIFYDMMSRKLNTDRDFYMDDFHIKPTKCLQMAISQLDKE